MSAGTCATISNRIDPPAGTSWTGRQFNRCNCPLFTALLLASPMENSSTRYPGHGSSGTGAVVGLVTTTWYVIRSPAATVAGPLIAIVTPLSGESIAGAGSAGSLKPLA
jgi:hypothetical protein